MPFSVPTLPALQAQAQGYYAARVSGAKMFLRRAMLRVFAAVDAALAWFPLRFAVWISRQVLPDTQEGAWLQRTAGLYAIARTPATYAGGVTAAQGIAGTPIPEGSQLQALDGSAFYVTSAAVTLDDTGNAASLPITATTAGAVGNQDAGAELAFVVAIAGVSPTVTVGAAGLTGGEDTQSDDALRADLIARLSSPPQGGAATDYVAWAMDPGNASRAWCCPLWLGAGTVGVTFMLDERTDPIPQATDVAAMQALIGGNPPGTGLAPVTAQVTVFAPAPDPIDILVGRLVIAPTALLADVEAGILAAETALFQTTTPGGAGVGPGVTESTPAGYLALEAISDAITQVSGVVSFDLVQPTADIQSAAGHIAQLGAVAYQ